MNPLFKRKASSIALISSLLLAGCGSTSASGNSGQESGSSNPTASSAGYPQIKAMVLDILHSKEGMNTLKDTISSPEFKQSAIVSEIDVQKAVEKMVKTEDKQKTFLSQAMKDPKFSSSMVEAALPQVTKIQKQLIKDPDYQKELLALMQSSEYQQMQFDLLKSPEYRKEIMKIMTEALEQPSFRLLFMDSLKQAVKEAAGGQKEKITGSKEQGKGKSGQGGGSQDSEGGAEEDSSGGGEESGGS